MAFSFSELLFNSQPFILIYILLNVLFAVKMGCIYALHTGAAVGTRVAMVTGQRSVYT